MTKLPDLPVSAVLPQLAEALASGNSAVLVAPPGAGKTTLVPLASRRCADEGRATDPSVTVKDASR